MRINMLKVINQMPRACEDIQTIYKCILIYMLHYGGSYKNRQASYYCSLIKCPLREDTERLMYI